MASRFVAATGAARDTLYKDAELFAGAFGPKYKYYLRVMEKVLNGTENYVEKESNRYVPAGSSRTRHCGTNRCDVYSLQSILKNRNLSPQKLDEVKIKANILSTFKVVEEKPEEVVEEKAEGAVGHDSAEL